MGPECAVPFKVGEEALSFSHLQQGVKMPPSWKLDAALHVRSQQVPLHRFGFLLSFWRQVSQNQGT
jgi:hypothetical protein